MERPKKREKRTYGVDMVLLVQSDTAAQFPEYWDYLVSKGIDPRPPTPAAGDMYGFIRRRCKPPELRPLPPYKLRPNTPVPAPAPRPVRPPPRKAVREESIDSCRAAEFVYEENHPMWMKVYTDKRKPKSRNSQEIALIATEHSSEASSEGHKDEEASLASSSSSGLEWSDASYPALYDSDESSVLAMLGLDFRPTIPQTASAPVLGRGHSGYLQPAACATPPAPATAPMEPASPEIQPSPQPTRTPAPEPAPLHVPYRSFGEFAGPTWMAGLRSLDASSVALQGQAPSEPIAGVTADMRTECPGAAASQFAAACKATWGGAKSRPARAWPLLRAGCYRPAEDTFGRPIFISKVRSQLEYLMDSLTNGKFPAVLDLAGATLRLSSTLEVTHPDITIRNGHLALAAGCALVASAASHVVLEDVEVCGEGPRLSCSSDVAPSRRELVGLVEARGAGVALTLTRCTVSVSCSAGQPVPAVCGVLAVDGGQVTAVHSTVRVQQAPNISCNQPMPSQQQRDEAGGMVAHGGESMVEAHMCTVSGHQHGYYAAADGTVKLGQCRASKVTGSGFFACQGGKMLAGDGCVAEGAGQAGFCVQGAGSHLVAGTRCVAQAWGTSGSSDLAGFTALAGGHMELGGGCMAAAGRGTGFLARGKDAVMVAGSSCSAVRCSSSGFDACLGGKLRVGAAARAKACGGEGFHVHGCVGLMVVGEGAAAKGCRGCGFMAAGGAQMGIGSGAAARGSGGAGFKCCGQHSLMLVGSGGAARHNGAAGLCEQGGAVIVLG